MRMYTGQVETRQSMQERGEEDEQQFKLVGLAKYE